MISVNVWNLSIPIIIHLFIYFLFIVISRKTTCEKRNRECKLHETSHESQSLREQLCALKSSREQAIHENGLIQFFFVFSVLFFSEQVLL